jgi:hypothetical protein
MWHAIFHATRQRFTFGSLVALGALGACGDVTPVAPTRPPDSVALDARRTRQEPSFPAEARFVRLAHIVPGFGGYFFDGDGNLHAYLSDLSKERQLRGLLRPLLDRRQRQASRRRPRVIVHQGRYDFLQLATWRDGLFREGYRALHSIGVDEAQNVVRVGAATPNDSDLIGAIASRLGIPKLALRIDVSAPEIDLQTLSSVVVPPVGGILITAFETGGQCALGFNTNNGTSFVTGSHCTRVRGPDGSNPTDFLQPDASGYYAGFESLDPAYFSNAVNSQCPTTDNVCRWSDAALIEYVASVAPGAQGQGRLARTVYYTDGFTEDGSKDIVGYLTVTAEAPFPDMGQELGKIGPSSGWTAGPVIQTCVHIEAQGYTYLCQDVVRANAKLGDSGGPVFELGGGYTVTFHGIVRGWSAQYVGFSYSSLWNIDQDLGYLPVQ